MNDTPEHISKIQRNIFSKMNPAKRFQISTEFIDMGWNIARNQICTQNKSATQREISILLAKKMYNIYINDVTKLRDGDIVV